MKPAGWDTLCKMQGEHYKVTKTMENTYVKVGIVKHIRGHTGHLVARMDADIPSLAGVDTFFIPIDNRTMVPYGIRHCALQNDRAIIQLQAVQDAAAAQPFKGKSLFVSPTTWARQAAADPASLPLIGYQVIDRVQGRLGLVQSVRNWPGQKLWVVDYQAQELLIPQQGAIVSQIDHKQRQIIVDLPPGFLQACSSVRTD
ncbi:MAG: hypothetical protein AAFV97_03860 [Bacteroidota bacterium]